jgi:hypothetical protein
LKGLSRQENKAALKMGTVALCMRRARARASYCAPFPGVCLFLMTTHDYSNMSKKKSWFKRNWSLQPDERFEGPNKVISTQYGYIVRMGQQSLSVFREESLGYIVLIARPFIKEDLIDVGKEVLHIRSLGTEDAKIRMRTANQTLQNIKESKEFIKLADASIPTFQPKTIIRRKVI